MSENKPMNLLIILSDQHSKRMLGCYGNDRVKTPNLDRLAAEGVRFDNAYCNSPICVPSGRPSPPGTTPPATGTGTTPALMGAR